MYYQYFGLTEAPFSIAVNPRYLFMSARHRDALAHLLYGVGAGGFILLTGEVGTGKTTINRCLLEQLPDATDIAIILNPALNAQELLASACDELGIDYPADNPSLKTLTDRLHDFLLQNHGRGRNTVLMIDEAQHLDFEVLEQIRLLTNLETDSQKLLQIILIGQPELAQLLARPELRQLNQRITARYNLEPLNQDETGAYIRHRLRVAGLPADRELFPAAVVKGIYQHSRGIPRLINLLCDRLLLGAYGRNQSRVDRRMLKVAVREVMGEEQARPGASQGYRWAAAAVVIALIAAGATWWGQQRLAESSAAPAIAAPLPAPAAPQEPERQPAAAPLAMPPASAAQRPPAAASEPVTAEAAVAAPTRAVAASPVWQLGHDEGMQSLWQLSADGAPPRLLCQPIPERQRRDRDGPLCEVAVAGGWQDLRHYSRPLLLYLDTAQRHTALLLRLGGSEAQLWAPSGLVSLPLAQLEPIWRGEYSYLWHPPQGYRAPFGRWHEGPEVAAVARLFARLDGQGEPLAGTVFNEALDARVRLFQEQHGLAVDGVVGLQTLLKLNEATGVDVDSEAVRSDLLALGNGQ